MKIEKMMQMETPALLDYTLKQDERSQNAYRSAAGHLAGATALTSYLLSAFGVFGETVKHAVTEVNSFISQNASVFLDKDLTDGAALATTLALGMTYCMGATIFSVAKGTHHDGNLVNAGTVLNGHGVKYKEAKAEMLGQRNKNSGTMPGLQMG